MADFPCNNLPEGMPVEIAGSSKHPENHDFHKARTLSLGAKLRLIDFNRLLSIKRQHSMNSTTMGSHGFNHSMHTIHGCRVSWRPAAHCSNSWWLQCARSETKGVGGGWSALRSSNRFKRNPTIIRQLRTYSWARHMSNCIWIWWDQHKSMCEPILPVKYQRNNNSSRTGPCL